MSTSRRLTVALAVALATALVAPAAAADFTVSGQVRYVDREQTYAGGFTGAEPELAVRHARVRAIDAASGAVLASGATDAAGDFSLAVVAGGPVDVLVRVLASSTAFGPTVRVSNPSQQTYSIASPTFAAWEPSTDLDLGTLVAPKVFAAGRWGNPFNLLDQLVHALEWVQSMGAAPLATNVRMQWPAGPSSYALDTVAFIADDDGYDDLVQLHELGHVVQHVWSDNDQTTGPHFFGESDQDPRLSLGEGWATAFAGAVRRFAGASDPGFYLDASGSGATGPASVQVRLRLEDAAPYASTTSGEADEGAVACSLWDLVDDAATPGPQAGVDDDPVDGSFFFAGGLSGEELLWRALDGPLELAVDATVLDLWDGLFTPLAPGSEAALVAVFDSFGLRFAPDAAEPDGDAASATPLALDGVWSATRTLYAPAPGSAAPGDGDSDWFRLDLAAGTGVLVETRYPHGLADAGTFCDPFLRLWRPDGSLHAEDDNSGTGRNARVAAIADVAGAWHVEVTSIHPFRRTGSYQLRAELSGTDCNGNGTPDDEDVASGTSLDLDGDGTPDECQPLAGDVSSISVVFGGVQTLQLDAGLEFAGCNYWVVGTTGGTLPGLVVDGLTVPINSDGYTHFTLTSPNQAPLAGSLGLLDGLGRAVAQFSVAAGSSVVLAGKVVHHAYIAFDSAGKVKFASNPIPVQLVIF